MEGATVTVMETLSPSSRGRGLKFGLSSVMLSFTAVALFTRAWIEIVGDTLYLVYKSCRPLHEGVD